MWPGFLIDHMFFRKRHWHLISEWTLGLVNALNHHWYETSLLPQAVLKHVVFRDFIPKNSVRGTNCVSWTKIWHCFISDFFHVILHNFLKENFSMWVTRGSYVGHIWIALWVKWVNWCDPLSTLKLGICSWKPKQLGAIKRVLPHKVESLV